jgi:hypothetical protein
MPKIRSVASLLAAQPREDLVAMRDGLRAELTRLQTELEFVEEALDQKAPPRSARSGRKTRRESGRLPREELFKIIQKQGGPVSAPEVRAVLEEIGYQLRTEAVRTSMTRLVADGKLARMGDGLYAVADANGDKTDADSPLSRVGQRQSQGSRT